jgi:diguanylate cyclase (GGDEF)-like protein
LLAVVVAALTLVVYAVITLVRPGSAWFMLVFGNVALTVYPLCCTWMCVLGWRRARTGPRAGLVVLGSSAVAFAVGQGAWAYYELIADRPLPFPSLADIGFLLCVAQLLIGMALLVPRGRPKLRIGLDGALISASLLYLSWAFLLGPILDSGVVAGLAGALLLAYPLADVVMVSIAMMIMTMVGREHRRGLLTIAVGGIAFGLADSAFAYFTYIGVYTSGGAVVIGWAIGFFLVGFGALNLRSDVTGVAEATASVADHARGRPSPIVAQVNGPDGRTTTLGMVLPYVPVTIGLVVTVSLVIRDGSLDPVLYLLGVAVMVLVIARQFLALRDNSVLTRELLGREQQLAYLAFHDSLTGLANRTLFYDRVGHAVLRQDRAGTPVGLLYIDLDGFKAVNDGLGHAAGDELLKEVAERLTACLRSSDTVARLGGDEFAVLADPVHEVDDIMIVANRIVATIGQAFPLSSGVARIGASVGVATRTPGDGDLDDFLQRADSAMYAAKAAGKGRTVLAEH